MDDTPAATQGLRADVVLASVAIVLVAGAGAWFLLGDTGAPELDVPMPATTNEAAPAEKALNVTASTTADSAQTLAGKARMALNADMVAEPPGQNALYYYSLAVEADPDNTEFRDELNAVSDQVSTMIRGYIDAGDFATAEQLASRLQLAVPSAAVLREYELAVGNRRQQLLDQAVAAADGGNQREANTLLAAARALPGSADASIRQTQQRLATIASERQAAQAARVAAREAERQQQQQAAAASDANTTAAGGTDTLAAPETRPTVAAATVSDEPPADVVTAGSIREKISGGSLDGDSGAIAELRAALGEYPESEAVSESRTLLLSAVEARVEQQLAADDTRGAAGSIAAIESLPGADTVVPAMRSALGVAEKRVAGATLLPASQLEIVEVVQPQYPSKARRRDIEGWVDVEFTVKADGRTGDIVVVRTDKNDIFNRSAIQAVSQWQFKPRMFRGEAIDQRVFTRIGYRLQ
ncbi:MAG: energy transducer TonB [Pseudomonadota bacterium]